MKFGKFELKFDHTLLMGILNVTPDSFSDGGKFIKPEVATAHALQMVENGADIIDVGGESSRPGSDPVSILEELQRVVPVIEAIAEKIPVPISIDTYKPEVARKALQAGASIINDISGLRDPKMIEVAAESKAPVIIMHMLGTPKTMQENPHYEDVVTDIKDFLQERMEVAEQAGITNIIVDPGIGFGKTLEHNVEIIRRLGEFKDLGKPILVGPSRKSFIGAITDLPVEERTEGTLATAAIAAYNGANIIRVHDVKECRRALQIVDAIA